MLIAGVQKLPNRSFKLPDTGVRPAPNLPLGEQAEPPLDHVEPGGMGGRKVQMISGSTGKPATDGRSFMRGIVIQHHVHFSFGG